MLREEGLDHVFARHRRLAEAARAAVKAWGLEILCKCEDERSPVVTTVMMPEGHDATNSARSSPSASTCRLAPAWAGSRAAHSASATSATSTS